MALWQFELNLVPKKVLMTSDGKLPSHLTEDQQGNISGWDDSAFRDQAQSLIEKYLPKSSNYAEDYPLWGKEDQTCIHFFYDAGSQTGVWIRLDLRELNRDVLDLVQNLSNVMNALGLNERGELFIVTKDNLKEEIKKSQAFKFVKDPMDFIKETSRQHKK
jgi:hypothetical protein